jgi:hypothetical protein
LYRLSRLMAHRQRYVELQTQEREAQQSRMVSLMHKGRPAFSLAEGLRRLWQGAVSATRSMGSLETCSERKGTVLVAETAEERAAGCRCG